MSDEKRQGERVPVGLRVRLRFQDLPSFIAGYGANLSRGGAFLEGVAPRAEGTLVRFELLLANGNVALRGEGNVVWSRSGADRPGIAVKFTRLDSKSKALIDELVAAARVMRSSIPPPPSSIAVETLPTPPAAPRIADAALEDTSPRLHAVVAPREAPAPSVAAPVPPRDLSDVDAELHTLAGDLRLPQRSAVAIALADVDDLLAQLASGLSMPSREAAEDRPATNARATAEPAIEAVTHETAEPAIDASMNATAEPTSEASIDAAPSAPEGEVEDEPTLSNVRAAAIPAAPRMPAVASQDARQAEPLSELDAMLLEDLSADASSGGVDVEIDVDAMARADAAETRDRDAAAARPSAAPDRPQPPPIPSQAPKKAGNSLLKKLLRR